MDESIIYAGKIRLTMDSFVTKLSSKGQIVIPEDLRKDMKKGDRILAIREEDRIILIPMALLSKRLRADLEFARRTEQGLKEFSKGRFKEKSMAEFLREFG